MTTATHRDDRNAPQRTVTTAMTPMTGWRPWEDEEIDE
jgi:hypothetical protein